VANAFISLALPELKFKTKLVKAFYTCIQALKAEAQPMPIKFIAEHKVYIVIHMEAAVNCFVYEAQQTVY
jgi:hypothetical protein